MNMKNGSSETVTLVCNAKQSNRYGRTFGSILACFKSALRSKLQLFPAFTLYRFKILQPLYAEKGDLTLFLNQPQKAFFSELLLPSILV